ncbi:unknown similar to AMEV073 [Choristoneura rosaceana entomopoxvirus 'L']|uniref:Uncharacterized protein n=1 Tax=Choristoneura rosaceana entomopoxvirus 'L' TaxID=1293539 RepID=A0ABM9QK50_9POXV|nr:unknown similar to AMEV073 [Choristoneura rosaceana entomopoxvirus 'L']CCU55916.1 unknown similar to AMEV073 [Choristoneura rosaceana entomopoxvirus 'L']
MDIVKWPTIHSNEPYIYVSKNYAKDKYYGTKVNMTEDDIMMMMNWINDPDNTKRQIRMHKRNFLEYTFEPYPISDIFILN